ncbi:hypothetical protein FSP39_009400 [Pinctada imbricata]|uniref:Uncharacterized protein n=1 Tax=Pinctada imbricata TaxID=66713 RepID=A0AA88XE27_PINIB|nr:hypothetical protein FSP39_009400 [Pinctada imbricata]
MYITVRYGGEIDLSDENGNVKYLREIPNRYASEILAERETLILLKVDGKFPYFILSD